jgi:O-antigen/teichoic acid export membrane protein
MTAGTIVQRYRALVSGVGFKGNVLRLGGGTALGQALSVLALPVITRLYHPDEMGVLAIFVAFVGFVSVGVTKRLDMAIVSARSDAEADHLLLAGILAALPTSALAGGMMALMIRWNVLSYGTLPPWTAVCAAAALLLTGVFTALRYWHVRRATFGALSRALVTQGAGRAVAAIALGAAGAGWAGLVSAEIVGRSFGIWRLLRDALAPIRRAWADGAAAWRRAIAAHAKFPLVVLPSSLVDALASLLPISLVAALFGSAAAGKFLLVQNLGALPASFVAVSVADVLHERLAAVRGRDARRVRRILAEALRALALCAAAIYVPAMLLAPWACGLVLGRRWADAGTLFTILAPVSMVNLVVNPVSRLFLVVNRQERKLAADVLRLVLPIGGLVIAARHPLGFWPSMLVFSGLSTVAYLVYLALVWQAATEPTP